MSDLNAWFDGLGALFNYSFEELPSAKRAKAVEPRLLEYASDEDLEERLDSVPMDPNEIDLEPGEYSLLPSEDVIPSIEEISKPKELPVGLTVVVLEDEEVLNSLYTRVILETLSPEYFEQRGLPGLPEVEVLSFDAVPSAVQHFKDHAENYKNRLVAMVVDLNLRGASEQTKTEYADRMARQEVEAIPAWKRSLSLKGIKRGSLSEMAKGIIGDAGAIKEIIAGEGSGYDAWFETQVIERAPKYEKMSVKYGNRAIGEILSIGVKVIVADINSAEESANILGAAQPFVDSAIEGYFPIPTVNQKTPNDPSADADRLAAHIGETSAEFLKAYNQPAIVAFLSGGTPEDIEVLAQGPAASYHAVLNDHITASFTLSRMGPEYAPTLIVEDMDF